MSEYTIRKAKLEDIPFLTEAVISAEKGPSVILPFSTLFNLKEEEVRKNITSMFLEEIDGCEFAINSFLVVECEKQVVATFGSWIEGFDGNLSSALLKSNLIGFTFSKISLEVLREKSPAIKDLIIPREALTLQFEYLYIAASHRGKNLAATIMKRMEENALLVYPKLKKIQVQLFKNNYAAFRTYEKNGFELKKAYKSHHLDTLKYVSDDEKYLMEKTIKS